MTFVNWSTIQPAIAMVPQSAGQFSSVSVVNFGTTVYTGPLSVVNTLNRIRANNGPDRTPGDGTVYTNPQASGLPVDGTYYEFTVEPTAGTDRTFSGISFPGPMRILLATGGDCFFTGDHYSTFVTVSVPSAGPVIGSFTDNPTSVTVGSPTTLTASSVTTSSGTVSSVKFYRESNGTTGLQTAADTLIGTGSQSGTTWTISTSTTGLAASTYTYYAVATDLTNASSVAASTTLAVTNPVTGAPTMGSFVVSPSTVTVGASTTLTASSVVETGGTIANVKFYRESNSTAGLQTATDTLIGTGSPSGTTWSIGTSTTGLAAGTYTYYAVATDTAAVSSAVSSASLVVNGTATGSVLEAWNTTGLTNFGPQDWAATSSAAVVNNSPILAGTTDNWTSKYDLGSGALILAGLGATGLANVSNQVKQGLNNASAGGIYSSTAAADPAHISAIGVILNNDGNNNAIYGTAAGTLGLFGDAAPGVNDVLVKYTSVGDANLDGLVDGSDYTKIDNGYGNTTLTGWANGDFNYDGHVDGSDYTLIDNAFNTQSSIKRPSNLTDTGLTRDPGVVSTGSAVANGWGGSSWNALSAAGLTAGEDVTFGTVVSAGYSVSLSSIDLNYRRSSTGAVSGFWQYQTNGGAWVTIGDFTNEFSSISTTATAITQINLTGIAGLQNLSSGTVVNFRLTPYASTGTGGTWYIFDGTGNDLVLSGTSALA